MNRALVVMLVVVAGQQPEIPGGRLQDGMTLLYGRGASETAWVIDSVQAGTAIGTYSDCIRFRVRIGTNQPSPRVFCREGDILYTLRPDGQRAGGRPITPGAVHESRSPSGNLARYEVGALSVDTIGGVVVPVLPTVVTSRDSTGRVVRRLTERFSVGLLTATSGAFAVPDSAQPGGWRETQRFWMTGIR